MAVYMLHEKPVFPPADEADQDGLIAVGGDFSPERILNAYVSGIFPWFEQDGIIYWFSPDPRMILLPDHFKVSESLRRVIRSNKFEIRFDTCFPDVIRACAEAPRKGQDGTWISSGYIDGYLKLHQLGYAHSAECFHQGKLAGGLYGLSIGSAFFGESMFFRIPDASKVALYYLVKKLSAWHFHFIDCQVETDHLAQMGAIPVSRKEYLELLSVAIRLPTIRVFS